MIELLFAAALAMPVHDTQILNCNQIKAATKLREVQLANGLLAEAYDVDGDGKQDVVTLSSITGSNPAGQGEVPHEPFPIFYILDRDKDGQADTVMVDKNGDGFCESIVLYQNLNEPITPNSQRMIPDTGKTGL